MLKQRIQKEKGPLWLGSTKMHVLAYAINYRDALCMLWTSITRSKTENKVFKFHTLARVELATDAKARIEWKAES